MERKIIGTVVGVEAKDAMPQNTRTLAMVSQPSECAGFLMWLEIRT